MKTLRKSKEKVKAKVREMIMGICEGEAIAIPR